MFSRRTAWPLTPNRLHRLAEARREREGWCDLTVSNPTVCGFDYPAELLAVLADAQSLRYEPQPLGLEGARTAVVDYYRERGLGMAVGRVALTASTSEAYSHLFRLLCNAGESVLMPTPSYPLFEMLAGVQDVRLCPVPMQYADGWHLDVDALAAVGGDARALLLVHPNNPAGNYVKPGEWQAVQALAAARGWAVVVDEVFYDYAVAPAQAVALDFSACPALTFLLNGCSKLAVLPQMKLAWMTAFGPEAQVREAWARLEVLLDLYLSVSTPVQHAASALLGARARLQQQVRARLRRNLDTLDAALVACPALERLRVEGGWSVVLRLPRLHSDAEWAELLVERAGVLAHPGHFYGLGLEACLALSLLLPEARFATGIERLLAAVAAEIGKV
ncbi:MAG: pyridoxal phosphate-dependent aminotransferase [Terriglobales bacterium]